MRLSVAERPITATAVLIGTYVGLAAAAMSAQGVLVERFFHDIYVPIDYAWRSALGQVPHLDYHTPIGQAFTWPFRLLALAEPASPLMIVHAGVLVGGILLLIALAGLPRRLAPPLFLLTGVGAIAIAMSPRDLDAFWYIYSHNAPYNRWGHGVLVLLAAMTLLPRRGEGGAGWVPDGLLIGLMCGLLLYLKINFLMGAIGFVLLGAALRQLDWRAIPVAVLVVAAMIGTVELLFGNNRAYLGDLALAASVNRDGLLARLWGRDLLQTVAIGSVFVAVGMGVIWLLQPVRSVAEAVRSWWKPSLLLAGTVGIATVVHTQNNFTREVPPFLVAVIVVAEVQRRRMRDAGTRRGRDPGPMRRALAWTLVGVVGGTTPLLDAMSVVDHAVATHGLDAGAIPALRGTAGETLLVSRRLMRDFPDRPGLRKAGAEALLPPNSLAQRRRRWRALTAMEVRSLAEAMRLLRPHVRPGDVVFAVDFANPYPAFLRLPPPPGALTWWHIDRSFSATVHPDLDRMVDATTFVIQKRIDTQAGPHGEVLWPVIRSAVEARHGIVAQGELWTLWRARTRTGG
ncbi:MAG TPA: hypothetical protein VF592_12210 [Sphingomonas sp.]|jgi:hypothetical protein|uniref:hypothetical protein n=1 Tax=Sphingomonas sp. TaxID=28214 RepID=UPI002ED855E2